MQIRPQHQWGIPSLKATQKCFQTPQVRSRSSNPESPKMKPSIWTAPPSVFSRALKLYPTSLPSKPNLPELDSFTVTLRSNLRTRKPPHITAAEYSKLMTYKLSRGKWRPRLQKFADELSNEAVVAASEAAFQKHAQGDHRAALRALTEMKGCGPATASLVLSLVGACFMGDEILEAVFGERRYTEKVFLELQSKVTEKGEELGKGWTCWEVERAVYSAGRLGIELDGGKDAEEGKASRKRKREDGVKGVAPNVGAGRVKKGRGKPAREKHGSEETHAVGKENPPRRSQRLRMKT